MNPCLAIVLIDLIVFVGCGNNTSENTQPMAVYNQAYQENFTADSIADIISHAKDAYVLIDPFADNVHLKVSDIKEKNNQVAGYISVGTGEDWRDDFLALKQYLTPKVWPQWEGEFFVSETNTGILPIMKERINKMSSWGLDWVEFDNMDWLDDSSRVEFNLTATEEEAKSYINALCSYTHTKGMKCMAKNTVDGFESFDGVTYESYDNNKNWWDSDDTKRFLAQNKAVIIVHYNESDCDSVYTWYKSVYNSDKISFICEDVETEHYKHYNK